MRKAVYLFISILQIVFLGCIGKSEQSDKKEADSLISGKLVIFHAGSLSVPMKEIAQEFKKRYPDVEILMEAAGSVACARKMTELNQQCDIIAVADYKVIDNMLMPGYCQWNIPFAGNEMIIAFTSNSRYSSELNSTNWYNILMKGDVSFGRSDPNADPCGYRSLLIMQLADLYYNKEILKIMSGKDLKYIRPKETDLLALLQAGELDYIFIYRSVAIQHQLKYLILPDSINLKKPELENFYSKATVEINGSAPGQKQLMVGESMIYGISIPEKAANRKAAETFLDFLLSADKGMKIMKKNGQNELPVSSNSNFEKIPESLQKYVKK